MADTVAIVSVLASSAVAIASLGVQVRQSYFTRQSERQNWLRDRRAEAYLSLLPLFAKGPEDVGKDEFPLLWARLHAFASSEVRALFKDWSEVVRAANVMPTRSLDDPGFKTLFERSESLAREIENRVALELQDDNPG